MAFAALQTLAHLDCWQVAAVIVKAITYGATFAAAGGALFGAAFSSQLSDRQRREIARFVIGSALAAIVLSALRLAIMNAMMSGEIAGAFDRAMTRMVLESREGTATAQRLVGLVSIVLTAGKAFRLRGRGWYVGISLLGALFAATSFAWVGHAGDVAGGAGSVKLPQLLLCLHLVAVAFWLGALWPLHRLTYDSGLARVAAVMHRFGSIAAIVVGLLVAAGVLVLWLILGSATALWESPYGQFVLVKLLLVALLLALATVNKLRLTPLLVAGDQSAIGRLRRSIRAEMTFAALILLVTAAFTTVVGPPELG